MACEVKIIEDSINPYNGIRLTTFQVKYWRAIHSEHIRHWIFSYSATSSRAVPFNKILKATWENLAGPIHWGKNQPGMAAREELSGWKLGFMKGAWGLSGKVMCSLAWVINKVANPHKQILNRMLEPWSYISVVVTGTDWDNFYDLRCHPDAQPEIYELAMAMRKAQEESIPVSRKQHLPYISEDERNSLSTEDLFKVSSARCARVSYLTHDGKVPDLQKDIDLYNRLVGSRPIHASPTEHCAEAKKTTKFIKNLRGWEQHRVTVEKNLEANND